MNAPLAGLATVALLCGVLLVAWGVVPRVRSTSTASSTGLWMTVDSWWRRRTRRQRIQLAAAIGAGLLVFALTGWVLALVALPVLVLGIPALLAEPGNREIDTLEALDRWVRALATSLPTGKSITDAMRSTAHQAPELLAGPVQVMVARMDARWTTREALFALADDLDSIHADAVVAALVLAAQRGGTGATATLNELADTIQARLRALREIEAERSKPRVVVRQVTLISLVALSAAVVLQPEFFAPYGTPVGQLILVLQLTVYCLSLLALRRMTIPRRRDRILRRTAPRPIREGGSAPSQAAEPEVRHA